MNSDEYCISCGAELCNDDIGFHKKMINRGATEFMCTQCLAEYFGISLEKAKSMIEMYRESGCTLFVKK
ncbi:MAG: hypothetical protein GX051_02235 [Clostridiales bacterium]|nr:hypothetical protein [Clostridiales bacterium]